jgi:hypothetical protein
MQVNREIVVS